MSDRHDSDVARMAQEAHGRGFLTAVIVALLGTAVCFRLMYLSSTPGISGDEGWWGIQALAWLSGRPYEAHTTSGNPTDLFFLVPLALVHAIARPPRSCCCAPFPRSSTCSRFRSARQWWLFWPIAYLASQHSNVSVIMGPAVEHQPDFQEALRNGRLFLVEFVGTPELTSALDWVRARSLRAARTSIRDASGRDHLAVLQVAPAR
jgi:hypothetical protein